jgi:hypothetical protein
MLREKFVTKKQFEVFSRNLDRKLASLKIPSFTVPDDNYDPEDIADLIVADCGYPGVVFVDASQSLRTDETNFFYDEGTGLLSVPDLFTQRYLTAGGDIEANSYLIFTGSIADQMIVFYPYLYVSTDPHICFIAPASVATTVLWFLPNEDVDGFLASDGSGNLSFKAIDSTDFTPIVDADFANTPDTSDPDTDDLIAAIVSALISHGLVASA